MYRQRLDALAAVWEQWAEVGSALADVEWSTPSRCAGWDVAALFAHVGMFPQAVLDPLQAAAGAPVTAVDILRGFNTPRGVAHTMADQVADTAVAVAAQVGRAGLVALFADTARSGSPPFPGGPPTASCPGPPRPP